MADCDQHRLVGVLATLWLALLPVPALSTDIPLYEEQAELAGIEHVYDGAWEYFVGGGVASFDCNGDRLPDLVFAGGEGPAALYVNRSPIGGPLRFERQPGDSVNIDGVTGIYALDIDNDGHRDLVLLRVGENRLLRGGPECRFTPANARWKFDGGRAWSTAFAASIEPGQRFPTLAIGNYVDRHAPGSPWGTCHDNRLYRPIGDREEPDYGSVRNLSPGHCALSMLFTDWNQSGVDALRVTNDRHYHRGGEEQLWQLDAGAYPRLFTRSDGWERLVIWGMGIAEADLDADGFPEYALTSMGDTRLQRIDVEQVVDENRPSYEDVAWTLGATAHRPYIGDESRPSTGWHAEFDDVNNDARLDLFIAKGNVEAMEDFAAFDPDNLLLGQQDGRFVEVGDRAGIALDRRGRGASLSDLNADGLLDLVVVNRGAPVSLFRHRGARIDGTNRSRPGGNWLKIELTQPGDNRHAIGARLAIQTGNRVQHRRISVGGGHASGEAGFIHVGLGVAERATVRVQWPDGQWSAAYRTFANQHVLITRDEPALMYWYP